MTNKISQFIFDFCHRLQTENFFENLENFDQKSQKKFDKKFHTKGVQIGAVRGREREGGRFSASVLVRT